MAFKVYILFLMCAVISMCQVLINAQNQCFNDGANCQNHIDCCSGTCLPFSSQCARNINYYEPVSLDRDTLQQVINGLFASTEKPANYNVPPTPDLVNRFNDEDVATPSAQGVIEPVAVVGDCKIVGKKCFRDSECCTKRCHGFLHQCVT